MSEHDPLKALDFSFPFFSYPNPSNAPSLCKKAILFRDLDFLHLCFVSRFGGLAGRAFQVTSMLSNQLNQYGIKALTRSAHFGKWIFQNQESKVFLLCA
jgi:hypothetical protein